MRHYQRSNDVRLHRGSAAIDRAKSLGLALPDPVAAAADLVDQLEARRRQLPNDAEARRQTVEALLAQPSVNLSKLAAAEWARDVESNALVQAIDIARQKLTHTVAQYADALVVEARRKIFDPALELVTAATVYAPGTTTTNMILAGDPDAARVLVDATTAAERLSLAYRFRDGLFQGATQGLETARWKTPRAIDWTGAEDLQGLQRLLHGLQASELWFPTYAEADAADQALRADRRVKVAA